MYKNEKRTCKAHNTVLFHFKICKFVTFVSPSWLPELHDVIINRGHLANFTINFPLPVRVQLNANNIKIFPEFTISLISRMSLGLAA